MCPWARPLTPRPLTYSNCKLLWIWINEYMKYETNVQAQGSDTAHMQDKHCQFSEKVLCYRCRVHLTMNMRIL